jgi:hypothetical protein
LGVVARSQKLTTNSVRTAALKTAQRAGILSW